MPAKFQDNIAVRAYPSRDYEFYKGAGFRKSAFFKYNSTYDDSGYIHMKTNITANNRAWYMIEAVGYNYGLNSDVYCMWSFRPDIGAKTSTTIRTEGLNPTNTTQNGVYSTEDNYMVIYAYADSFYYIGFALNVFTGTNPESDPNDPEDRYFIPDVQIIASSLNQVSGIYY